MLLNSVYKLQLLSHSSCSMAGLGSELSSSERSHSSDYQHNLTPKAYQSWFRVLRRTEHTDDMDRSLSKKNRNRAKLGRSDTIISRSKKQQIWVVFIHIVPILATAIIVAINLEGYFIGTTFVGVDDAKLQSFALLSLQMTAKLLVGIKNDPILAS